MNFIDGCIVRRDQELVIDVGPINISLLNDQKELINNLGIDGEVVIGIRPEHVIVGEGMHAGEVYIIEPLGRDKIVHIKIGDIIIRALVQEERDIKEGEKIKFDFIKEKLHIFNPKSGKAYF